MTEKERILRVYSLDQEMERSAALLRRGIAGVGQPLYAGETARFLFMIDLAGGTERMLKVAWALAMKEHTGQWPGAQDFRAIGHRVLYLSDAVADLFPTEYLRREDARWGLNYLKTGMWFRPAAEILDDLARQGRYIHIDALGGQPAKGDSPERHWQQLEFAVGRALFPDEAEFSRRLMDGAGQALQEPIHAELARAFGTLGYILFRLLAAGLPSTEAKQWSVLWNSFLQYRPRTLPLSAFQPDQ
ncbi:MULTISPECIES: hypothetical protein [Deinococcus]|uniref:Uncharacterized protein n=1 Tax=Deinococcus rufus TaxID=2136097 RepID=A0ABV7ZEH4_9DEIO|nr:hypothetical protein [Deinococcus sp. AB2017081]WQE94058.1 hypothetical protein U2P90_11625 [Deinococcus sp. AB2017081]